MLYRETFRNALYYDIYIDGLYLLLLCIGPMTTLIFMNVRLVQAIRYVTGINSPRKRTLKACPHWFPKQDTLYPETGDFVAVFGNKIACFRIPSGYKVS